MIHVDRNAEFKMGLPAENCSLPRSKYILIYVYIPNNEYNLYFECVNKVFCNEFYKKKIFDEL